MYGPLVLSTSTNPGFWPKMEFPVHSIFNPVSNIGKKKSWAPIRYVYDPVVLLAVSNPSTLGQIRPAGDSRQAQSLPRLLYSGPLL